jgi:uracil-DNA glycosylase
VCTLGNFATKLLRGDPSTGITRLHGRDEERVIGRRAVRLYPIYHPAAALYTPSTLEILRTDFQRLPDLLSLPAPEQPAAVVAHEPPPDPQPQPPEPEQPEPEAVLLEMPADDDPDPPEPDAASASRPEPAQLGLF